MGDEVFLTAPSPSRMSEHVGRDVGADESIDDEGSRHETRYEASPFERGDVGNDNLR